VLERRGRARGREIDAFEVVSHARRDVARRHETGRAGVCGRGPSRRPNR
jgi:hypothetical protein